MRYVRLAGKAALLAIGPTLHVMGFFGIKSVDLLTGGAVNWPVIYLIVGIPLSIGSLTYLVALWHRERPSARFHRLYPDIAAVLNGVVLEVSGSVKADVRRGDLDRAVRRVVQFERLTSELRLNLKSLKVGSPRNFTKASKWLLALRDAAFERDLGGARNLCWKHGTKCGAGTQCENMTNAR